jgi:hypothetical protein
MKGIHWAARPNAGPENRYIFKQTRLKGIHWAAGQMSALKTGFV